jgi:hypothetical protein
MTFDVNQTLTLSIAVAALALSAFNTIERRRSKTRGLDVSLGLGIATGLGVQTALVLRAGNRSSADITAIGCGLRLPGPRTALFVRLREIPKRLASGDGLTEFEDLDVFKDALREQGLRGRVPIYGFVNDATGREHRARKPLMLDVA